MQLTIELNPRISTELHDAIFESEDVMPHYYIARESMNEIDYMVIKIQEVLHFIKGIGLDDLNYLYELINNRIYYIAI